MATTQPFNLNLNGRYYVAQSFQFEMPFPLAGQFGDSLADMESVWREPRAIVVTVMGTVDHKTILSDVPVLFRLHDDAGTWATRGRVWGANFRSGCTEIIIDITEPLTYTPIQEAREEAQDVGQTGSGGTSLQD